MKIIYTPQFLRAFKKINIDIKDIYRIKEKIFIENPFDKRLKGHRLKGRNEWSYSITYKIRVIFLIKDNAIILVNIGDHSKYR